MRPLEWNGNSKKMYQAILQGVPSFFRANIQTSIERWIEKNNVHVVTEELVLKAVDDIAPSKLAKTIKPQLEKLRAK